jgi:hypothetical protein
VTKVAPTTKLISRYQDTGYPKKAGSLLDLVKGTKEDNSLQSGSLGILKKDMNREDGRRSLEGNSDAVFPFEPINGGATHAQYFGGFGPS